jgi:hypothetical protein
MEMKAAVRLFRMETIGAARGVENGDDSNCSNCNTDNNPIMHISQCPATVHMKTTKY